MRAVKDSLHITVVYNILLQVSLFRQLDGDSALSHSVYTVHLYKAYCSVCTLFCEIIYRFSLVLFLYFLWILLNWAILFDVTGGTTLFLFDATDITILD